MAKKGTKKGVADQLPNRKYVVVTWGASTANAVYTSFSTMMGAREGAGWLISRVDVTPGGLLPLAVGVVTNTLRFQLCTGDQAGPLLAIDDDQVICTMDYELVMNVEGASHTLWPMTWVGPVLVASRDLTCLMVGSSDKAPWQAVDMTFTIWYQWVQLGAREWVEIAEARGIA